MIAPDRIVVALLAAGASRRFGEEDKLLAPYRGKRLVRHAAETIAAIDFAEHIAIVRNGAQDVLEALPQSFRQVLNEAADSGMGSSVALAANEARACHAAGLLICLGDMPAISTSVLLALCVAADGDAALICCGHGDLRSPPALFGRSHFAELAGLGGDAGARRLLREAATIEVSRDELLDIDTRQALLRDSEATRN